MAERLGNQGTVFKLKERQAEAEPIPVSRAYLVQPKVADFLIRELEEGKEPSTICVDLGKKLSRSVPSANMLTPVGGKRRPGETPLEGAVREVHEETTTYLCPFPLSSKDGAARWTNFVSSQEYTYNIAADDPAEPSRYDTPRRVSSVVLLALPNEILQTNFPHPDKDKMEDIPFSVTLDEFETLIHAGEISQDDDPPLKLIESSTLLPKPEGIKITGKQRHKRDAQLQEVVGFMRDLNDRIKEDLIKKVDNGNGAISLSEVYAKLKEDRGEEQAKAIIANAMNEMTAEIYVDGFKQVEKSVFGDVKVPESVKVDELILFDDTEEDKKAKAAVIRGKLESLGSFITERLNHGNFGIDILHLLPLVTRMNIGKPELTQLFTAERILLGNIFTLSAVDTIQALDLRIDYKNIREILLRKDKSLDRETVFKLSRGMHARFIKYMSVAFRQSEGNIKRAWDNAGFDAPEFFTKMRSVDHELEHSQLTFPVTDKSIPYCIAIAQDNRDIEKSYAAAFRLTSFLKNIPTMNGYIEATRNATTSIYALGVRDFADSDRYKDEVFIDNKGKKPYESYKRKAYHLPLDDIKDPLGYSIVHLTDAALSPQERIMRTNQMIEDFLKEFKDGYPSYNVEVVEDRDTFDAFLRGDRNASGKRTGSQGNLIIRRKICVKTTEKDPKDPKRSPGHFCEFTFYPFKNIRQLPDPNEITRQGWMAYDEKRDDDPGYVLARAYEPMRGELLGLRSYYEFYRPASIYIDTVRNYPHLRGGLGRGNATNDIADSATHHNIEEEMTAKIDS